ncbi:MAG: hypothetical protein K6G16_02015 [Lachnospiraceae bacterium]|nr:hypothetical protein [Lachnospiraceae bacterium]
MKRRISTNTYRLLDLAVFAFLLLVLESVIVRAARVWYADQLYTVSLAAAVTGIVMMRWGAWGLIHAALGGMVFAAANGGTAEQFVIYTVGNLAAALALVAWRPAQRDGIRNTGWLTLVYAVFVQVAMQAGRAVTAVCFGEAVRNCLGFFTTDTLSVLFTMVILWIARRQDGLLEDQRTYLRRIHEEERRKREDEINGEPFIG